MGNQNINCVCLPSLAAPQKRELEQELGQKPAGIGGQHDYLLQPLFHLNPEMVRNTSTCKLSPLPEKACEFRGHFTLELEAHDHWNLKSLVNGKCRNCPTSLSTRVWGPKGPRNMNGWTNLYGFLHGIQWILLHGLPRFESKSTSKRWVYHKSGRSWYFKNLNPWFIRAYFVEGRTWIGGNKIAFSWEFGHICLHTTLEGPWPLQTQFHISMVWPLDEFQGHSQFHGHARSLAMV